MDHLAVTDDRYRHLKLINPNNHQQRYESLKVYIAEQFALTYRDGSSLTDEILATEFSFAKELNLPSTNGSTIKADEKQSGAQDIAADAKPPA